ncbi:IS66 family insertion sequence element accessory protein TnpB [Ileibacterium valens]|uniref:IS66 family insertion sequence element accessory protein TnpB n=1 Tax=Ileibacterium valens TaxID=1862668 RepID=UPI00272B4598|nr:IS66 family insertion sequence element accessory protein TnpB [Ileibacterium valens]
MNLQNINVDKVYLAAGYTDMRLGIDGLAALCEYVHNIDTMQNVLFLFCGRKSDRIKGLLWQGDGYLLLYKRLNSGRFRWPRNKNEVLELSEQQLRWLLDGLSITQKTSIKQVPKRGENTLYKA